ncbi:leucine-rich repeat-containing protein 26 [Emydura macquarii macquarii]|uniref:leucine-rich repeat-containing protein 26 n=1 Tax=Emydura macquarii macquarii TaxID=1129001 RepID=UPI00352A5CCC
MAGWTGLAPLLAFLLLLCPFSSPACPAACRCSLGEVDCSYQALRSVPENLPADASAVRLAFNHIAVLKAHAFPMQQVLQNLSLHSNVLVSIHRRAFAGLGALRELDLSNNYLTVLTAETFLPLPWLATLNLGSNKLGQLPPAVLRAMPCLQELFLHSNALQSLHADVFPNLPAVRCLTLKGNPWECTCEIQPLFLWIMDNPDKIQEENLIQCRFPEHLNQYPLTVISNESFSHCQDNLLLPRDYAFFLLVGPASCLASIIVCLLLGSLAVAYDRLLKKLEKDC